MFRPLPALCALAVIATAVTAQETEIDSDGDGMISFGELVVALPETTEESFMAMDLNADGLLDAEEVAAATEAGLLPAAEDEG